MLRLMSISGSLRAASSNGALLEAARLLAPAGVEVEPYGRVGELPHFNPDDEAAPADIIINLRAQVGHADGLIISCPEYARGIPGSFKNMLDWLVGSETFPGKPVVLFNASARATAAQEALKLVLATMSAAVADEAQITLDLLAKNRTGAAIAADPALAGVVAGALERFVAIIRAGR